MTKEQIEVLAQNEWSKLHNGSFSYILNSREWDYFLKAFELAYEKFSPDEQVIRAIEEVVDENMDNEVSSYQQWMFEENGNSEGLSGEETSADIQDSHSLYYLMVLEEFAKKCRENG